MLQEILAAYFSVLLPVKTLDPSFNFSTWSLETLIEALQQSEPTLKELDVLRLQVAAKAGPEHRAILKAARQLLRKHHVDKRFIRCFDHLTEPPRQLTEMEHHWIRLLRSRTRVRSALSFRKITAFYRTRLLPAFNLSLETCPRTQDELQKHVLQQDPAARVPLACGTNPRYWHMAQVFLCHVVGLRNLLLPGRPPPEVYSFLKKPSSTRKYFTCEELEQLQQQSVFERETERGSFDELMFMLILTTGMRVGGFVHLRCADVATFDHHTQTWMSKQEGITLEKGSKSFTFLLHPRVQELLHRWLNLERLPRASIYVFPYASNRPETHLRVRTCGARFRQFCLRAGLVGPHCHLHSLRHTYARLLRQEGNSLEVISALMNHDNVRTVQHFYLPDETVPRLLFNPFDSDAKKTPVPVTSSLPSFLTFFLT